jgi:hypothetical protein
LTHTEIKSGGGGTWGRTSQRCHPTLRSTTPNSQSQPPWSNQRLLGMGHMG